MKKTLLSAGSVLLIAAIAATSPAPFPQGSGVNLITFSDGTPALASEVNANFLALRDRLDLSGKNIVDGSLAREDLEPNIINGALIQDGSLTFADLSTQPGDFSGSSNVDLTGASNLTVGGTVQVGGGTGAPQTPRLAARATQSNEYAIHGYSDVGLFVDAFGVVGEIRTTGTGSVSDLGPAGVLGILDPPPIGLNSGISAAVRGVCLTPNAGGQGVLAYHAGLGEALRAVSESGVGLFCATLTGNRAFTASGDGLVTGDLQVSGTLSKAGGSFKIDHPLDPANKTLSHSFVESPDMMNIYNGNAVLDAGGLARVQMADWFSALNRDFRYQLTPIGGPGQVWIERELGADNAFVIGGPAGLKVSWQITGIRHDAWAEANRIPVEEDKPLDEVGTYQTPEAHGFPETMRTGYVDPRR